MSTGQPAGHDSGHPDTMPGQAFIRWRTEQHQRLVPHTIDGHTEFVSEDYTVRIPVPPRDWDHIVMCGVLAVAAVLVTASIVWSTASIGDLLAAAVLPAVAYLAAVAFDAAWIACMALEWLARYDRERAKLPMMAGHAALAVAMTAVCVHGWRDDSMQVGLIGAAVSALAKGLWTVVLAHIAPPIDERTRQWLLRRDARFGAQLAIGARRRQHARQAGQYAALLAATGGTPTETAEQQADNTEDAVRDDGRCHERTVLAAVRAAADTLPGATPEDIADHLSAIGIDVDADTVRTLLDNRPDTTVRPIRPSIADSVRTAVAAGKHDPSDVLSYVRTVHGQDVRTDSVDRTLRRELSKRGA